VAGAEERVEAETEGQGVPDAHFPYFTDGIGGGGGVVNTHSGGVGGSGSDFGGELEEAVVAPA
jgi:hypothetical protein